jgi:hypothetical protein
MFRTVLLTVLVAAPVGCDKAPTQSREGSCDARSVCGDLPGPTPGEQGFCAEALADPACQPAYRVALACVQQHEACTTDGQRDVAMTEAACAAVVAAALVTPACLVIVGQDAGATDAAP